MFDAHAHVAFSQFDKDRADVIQRAREAGLSGWLEVGTDLEHSKKAVALAEKEDGVFATVGVHPTDISSITESTWVELRELLQHPKVRAIGEVGLDFYRAGNPEEQKTVVGYFLEIAREAHLPIIFHIRSGPNQDAHDELLFLLSALDPELRPAGVIHTYSGTAEQARKYLELGMYLSFSGVVTFGNAEQVLEAARWAPLGRILIETDCPYLAPAPYRGKRNEPAYVKLVAEKLAEVKNVEVEKLIEHTDRNVKEVLQI